VKIYYNFDIPGKLKNSILLIGNFDGLHVGHQKLFNLAKKFKKKFKSKIGVITFEPMPKMYFNKNLKNFRISNPNQKKEILKNFGTDFLIIKKFNKKFSKIKSLDFIKKILYQKLNTKFLFVSSNFRFGNKREGDIKQLTSYERIFRYKLIKPKPLKLRKKIVSSTLIRKLISKGKINLANKLLNRKWSIFSKVQEGKKLGKKIGFPTCNLDINDYVIAKPGVYAVKIYQKNKKKCLNGIANLGYRPTFNQKKLLLEVHIFKFNRNIYNKYLTIEFIDFIRKEKKFKNINQLKKQINLDIKIAKKKLN
tara:strand:+ start:1127 stop:2050 length:924 start_codon:yes stop_codon:yes gene_type:complete